MKTLIIAEAGVNHNGDIEVAKRLIAAAANSGADLVKFQSFVTSINISKNAPKAEYQKLKTGENESQYDMVRKLELSRADHEVILSECNRCGIGFFSTAFDAQSFDMLIELGVTLVKIPSGELTNLPLIRYMTRLKLPVLLSTGMANLGEVEAAINVIEQSGTPRSMITVLHCTTEYPAPISEVNLRSMLSMRDAFGVDIGYSDHTHGVVVPIAAVAIGAKVIEKHLTLDRNMIGPDHSASLEPLEFKAMVDGIRNIEQALGDGIKRPSQSENKNIVIARRSIVALKKIKSGELLSVDNITTKRPGSGISPMHWDEIIGMNADRDYEMDEMIDFPNRVKSN